MDKKKQDEACVSKQFEKIDEEKRNELDKELREHIVKFFQTEEEKDGYYKYEVELQDIRFFTYMSDKELEKSSQLAIDLLEELKEINNGGMVESEYREKVQEIEENEENEALRILKTWDVLCSDKMRKIIAEIAYTRRVGGAYAMLISIPMLKNAYSAVYDRIVDAFDNEEWYWHSAFFLLRAIMMMHSDKIENEEERAE